MFYDLDKQHVQSHKITNYLGLLLHEKKDCFQSVIKSLFFLYFYGLFGRTHGNQNNLALEGRNKNIGNIFKHIFFNS